MAVLPFHSIFFIPWSYYNTLFRAFQSNNSLMPREIWMESKSNLTKMNAFLFLNVL